MKNEKEVESLFKTMVTTNLAPKCLHWNPYMGPKSPSSLSFKPTLRNIETLVVFVKPINKTDSDRHLVACQGSLWMHFHSIYEYLCPGEPIGENIFT